MKKNLKKWISVLTILLTMIISIAIGGLFINGTFTGVVILSYLPQIVHTVVGWIVVVGSLITGIMALIDKLK